MQRRPISISKKLLISVLMVSSIVSLCATAIELYWDYRVDLTALDERFTQIQRSYVPSLSDNLWSYNTSNMRISLEGIRTFNDIEYVAVEEGDHTLVFAGTAPTVQTQRRTFPLTYSDGRSSRQLGKLVVIASMEGIYLRLRNKVVVVLLTHFFKTLLFSFAILAIFQQLVTRHIRSAASYLRSFVPGQATRLQLDRSFEFSAYVRDEIDELSESINSLAADLQRSYKDLESQLQATQNAERQLLGLNQNLEAEVAQRTREVVWQQQHLQNAAKLSALGQMAGGMAHEINNPLAIIDGLIFKLETHVSQRCTLTPQDLQHTFNRLHHTINRISRIIIGLRAFSRDGSHDDKVPTRLTSILRDALALCREKFIASGIRVDFSRPAVRYVVSCRATEICQIMINLLNNAFDAVAGTVEPWIQIRTRVCEGFVEILVVDSGPGVPVDIRDRIMEPFYTTKPLGRGTGIGLSISNGIAQSHGGDLYFDHQAAYSTFILRLPLDPTSVLNPLNRPMSLVESSPLS